MKKHDFLHHWPRFDEPHTDACAKKSVPFEKSRVSLLPIHYSVVLGCSSIDCGGAFTTSSSYSLVKWAFFLLIFTKNECSIRINVDMSGKSIYKISTVITLIYK